MRTNIEIQKDILTELERLGHVKSQRQAIEKAIGEFIKYVKRKRMSTLYGKVKWEGDLNDMRAD